MNWQKIFKINFLFVPLLFGTLLFAEEVKDTKNNEDKTMEEEILKNLELLENLDVLRDLDFYKYLPFLELKEGEEEP